MYMNIACTYMYSHTSTHKDQFLHTTMDVPTCNAGIAHVLPAWTESEGVQQLPVSLGPGRPRNASWPRIRLQNCGHKRLLFLWPDHRLQILKIPNWYQILLQQRWIPKCSATLWVVRHPRLWPAIVPGTIVVVVIVASWGLWSMAPPPGPLIWCKPRPRLPVWREETVAAWVVEVGWGCELFSQPSGMRGIAKSWFTAGEDLMTARTLLENCCNKLINKSKVENCCNKFKCRPLDLEVTDLKDVKLLCMHKGSGACFPLLTNWKFSLSKYY